jgi:hypothetical protein
MTYVKRLFQNDFFLAFLFLVAYLCTNSYIFAWDDQHLEIPLLQRLIDPTLYKGDYYVEGLVKNFSSYLYPILARIISTDQIQPTYIILFLIARFWMFYWVFRLWNFIAKDRFAASMAVLMFFLMGRTEEFLYRTFSHQEFSYMFMFAGFYYFYKERFLVAAIWLGIGANFHAIYNLFPFAYMIVYLLLFNKNRVVLISKSMIAFILFALPFLYWQIPHSLHRDVANIPKVAEWLPLYLIACQQNFIFWTSTLNEALQNIPFILVRLEPYLYLLGLYAFLMLVEKKVRDDKKLLSVVLVSYAFIMITYFFSYVHPSRFIIDLNLLRNEQFVRFMLMGYLTIWAYRIIVSAKPLVALLVTAIFMIIGFGTVFQFVPRFMQYKFSIIAILACTVIIFIKPQLKHLQKYFIAIILLSSFVNYSIYHYYYLQMRSQGTGLWQMHRNWVDMQKYVRAHTPKDSVIMTPYDTEYGGFRIYSQRRVLVCYRDCGIIGFDYPAILEWDQRIKDIKGFQMYVNAVPQEAILKGILKYKVDYIVFMNYYQPNEVNPIIKKLYQNEVFSLYEVHTKKI